MAGEATTACEIESSKPPELPDRVQKSISNGGFCSRAVPDGDQVHGLGVGRLLLATLLWGARSNPGRKARSRRTGPQTLSAMAFTTVAPPHCDPMG